MVLTGQMARDRNFGQNLANDAAQRVLGENVVANVVLRHPFLSFFLPLYSGILRLLHAFRHESSGTAIDHFKGLEKVKASVARCLRTPPAGATRQDFE
ncbi:hypothetical protein NN6n1_15000 [Shinella zoogloeoides]